MRYLLVINPQAGSGRRKADRILSTINTFFRKRGHGVTITRTRKRGDAIQLTRRYRKSHDVIIACGGDGTINEVVNGLAGSSKPLGIIPLGTENVLARFLGIPSGIEEACARILRGRTWTIDLGKTNGRYFLLWTGIGFDAHVASKVELEPLLKKFIGSIAYPLTAIKEAFSYEPARLTARIGKRRYTGYYIIVSNCRYYGARIPMAYRAQLDDGLLDVCIFPSPQIYGALRYLASATLWKKDIFRDARYIKTTRLRVTADKPTLVHTDCEIIGTTPVDITIKKKALRIIC